MIKVMIVEDEPAAMNYIVSLIRSRCSGLEIVAQAEDGTEAVEMLKNTQVDILITDVQMTHMNGIELAQWVSSSNRDIISLIISGHSDFEYVKGALKAGVVEYLLKPINPATFVETMEELSGKVNQKLHGKRQRWLRKSVAGAAQQEPFPGLAPELPLLIGVLILGGDLSGSSAHDETELFAKSPVSGTAATYIHRANEICFALPGHKSSAESGALIASLAEGAPYHTVVLEETTASGGQKLPEMLQEARNMMASGMCRTLHRQGESGKLAGDIEVYIREHLGEALSIQNICDVFSISASYLTQIFRKHIQKTFVEYIKEQRIEEAKKMMKEHPQMPIKDIAQQLGFSDQFYFSKVFRAAAGVPPSEFRDSGGSAEFSM